MLELTRPGDVGLFVEARLDLDDRQHLLAGLCCIDQGVHDGGVTAGAIEGLLDGQDLRVRCCLLDKCLNRCREGVVRVLEEDVLDSDRGQDVAGL